MHSLTIRAAALVLCLAVGTSAQAAAPRHHHSHHHHSHHRHHHHSHQRHHHRMHHHHSQRHHHHDYYKKNGTAFKYGYYFKGKNHRHWSYGYWNARYRVYFFYEPGLRTFYYWNARQACYYPVSYITIAPPVEGDETMPPDIDIRKGPVDEPMPPSDGPDGQ